MVAEKIFAEGVVKQIKTFLPPEHQKLECKVTEQLKNNSVRCVGLSIHSPDRNAEYIVDMHSYYDEVREGKPLGRVMQEIAEQVRIGQETENLLNGTGIETFQNARYNLMPVLVNTDANRRMLSYVPHKEIEDLSVICQVEIPLMGRIATTKVTNDLLKRWQLSRDQLFDAAMENVQRANPYIMKNLITMVEELDSEFQTKKKDDDFNRDSALYTRENHALDQGMYVLTSWNRSYGASAVLCPEMMEKLSKKFPGGCYLLPSSIHEFMAFPKSGYQTAEDLGRMVRDINKLVLSKDEILSDRIYEYDKSRGAIRQVPESIDRRREMER